MSDNAENSEIVELRERAVQLETQLREVEARHTTNIIRLALEAEALRAGMIDLDGLKLVNATSLEADSNGNVVGACSLVSQLRESKPWLFGVASSSALSHVPGSAPARQKLATEMSLEEWRAARADLLRRR